MSHDRLRLRRRVVALVSELRLAGYDHVISIEHEDSLMSVREGLSKAVALLKDAVIVEVPGRARWVGDQPMVSSTDREGRSDER